MSNRSTHLITLGLVLASVAAGAAVYGRLPETMATHWNFQGAVDGTMPRLTALAFVPAMMALMYLLFLFLIAILPLRQNVASFRPVLNVFFVGLEVFFLYIQGITLAWNLGARFRMEMVLLPAMGVLFYLVGIVLGRAKRNWMVGIRTPWTLSSDTVWEKTHRLGSIVFRVVAVLTVIAAFLGGTAAFIGLAAMMLGSLLTVVYSYFVWRAEEAVGGGSSALSRQ